VLTDTSSGSDRGAPLAGMIGRSFAGTEVY